MKKRIISNVVLARLLVSSSGLHAQESMFERKMKDAGQALQSLNQAFQTATSNFINQVTISPEIWRKLKAGAAALAAAIIAAAASYLVYKISSVGSSGLNQGLVESFDVDMQYRRNKELLKALTPGQDLALSSILTDIKRNPDFVSVEALEAAKSQVEKPDYIKIINDALTRKQNESRLDRIYDSSR